MDTFSFTASPCWPAVPGLDDYEFFGEIPEEQKIVGRCACGLPLREGFEAQHGECQRCFSLAFAEAGLACWCGEPLPVGHLETHRTQLCPSCMAHAHSIVASLSEEEAIEMLKKAVALRAAYTERYWDYGPALDEVERWHDEYLDHFEHLVWVSWPDAAGYCTIPF